MLRDRGSHLCWLAGWLAGWLARSLAINQRCACVDHPCRDAPRSTTCRSVRTSHRAEQASLPRQGRSRCRLRHRHPLLPRCQGWRSTRFVLVERRRSNDMLLLTTALVVFAVEASEMACTARLVVAMNRLQAVVEVFHQRIEDVVLPEAADIIVSEWMGCFLYAVRINLSISSIQLALILNPSMSIGGNAG